MKMAYKHYIKYLSSTYHFIKENYIVIIIIIV